jgi:hypothetical protein
MPPKKNRRWIFAVLVATVFPAIAFHVSCVAALGPGTWGSGLQEKLPELLPLRSSPEAQAYAREFSERSEEGGKLGLPELGGPETSDAEAPWKGTPIWADTRQGLWAIQTYEGDNRTQGQHLYLWDESSRGLEEIRLPVGWIVENPALIERQGEVAVVYGRWNSWALSPTGKLGRYARSWFEPQLRPEYSFYIYDPSSQATEYAGPGHSLRVSPDHKRGVMLRSGASAAGYYSIHIWRFDSDQIQTILSLREADEGSGRSFGYRWSLDSRAIDISGATGGFKRRQREARHFHLIYLVDSQQVYEVE